MLRRAVSEGRPYRVVLTDASNGALNMNGFDLASEVGKPPYLTESVILMLASGPPRDHLKLCADLGVAGYLIKPVRPSELRTLLASALATYLHLQADHAAPPVKDVARVAALSPRPPTGHRILLAEDNPVNRQIAVRMLESEGHQVVVAANGREALAAWRGAPFDVILMDVQMPEMDGFQTAVAIRRAESVSSIHVPIIAITAHAMADDRERCLAAGMDDYVSKPIRKSDLIDAIARHTQPSATPDLAPV